MIHSDHLHITDRTVRMGEWLAGLPQKWNGWDGVMLVEEAYRHRLFVEAHRSILENSHPQDGPAHCYAFIKAISLSKIPDARDRKWVRRDMAGLD